MSAMQFRATLVPSTSGGNAEPVACDLVSRNYSTILPYFKQVAHLRALYVGHAVLRYNGAFPKWREGRASGCWFPVCPETGELLLGTSCCASKEDKREEDLKNSHVTCVSRVRRDAPYYCYYCNAT